MALIFADGFESFGTTPGAAPVGLTNKWGNNNVGDHDFDTIIAGRFDGFALRPSSDSSTFNATVTPLFPTTQTLVAGVAFRVESLPSSGNFRDIMTFDSGSGTEVGVAVNNSGGVRVFRLQNTTNIEESATGLIEPNKWYYLEMKATIANSGSYEVRLDGVDVVSGTGDTQQTNPFADRVRLVGRNTSSATVWPNYDDFYVLDTTGTPNDFLGPRHIYTIFPTAAGDSTQWTPNTGNNFEAVDDNGHDTDTSYIASTTQDQKDLYQFGNVSGAADITAAVVYGIVRKTDVSAFDFIGVAKSNGVEAQGSGQLVESTTYHSRPGIFLTDPDSSAAWTESGINAAQFGLKVGF